MEKKLTELLNSIQETVLKASVSKAAQGEADQLVITSHLGLSNGIYNHITYWLLLYCITKEDIHYNEKRHF